MFAPQSVAVVGASADPAKWGYWLASGALDGRDRRAVSLVNRRGGSLRGTRFHPSLGDLPDGPEHVVIAVPPPMVDAVVDEGLELGARWFTVITSGLGTPQEEAALAERIRRGGARLLGPNCMGAVDTANALNLTWGRFPPGNVGLVSQSGNLALEIGRLLERAGEGISRFVSLGNQRDVGAADMLEALIGHDATRVIAVYVEDFGDGRRFARLLARARRADRPVLVLTVGRSEASGRAAASHTGAMITAADTVAAVCRDTGALLVSSAGELVDAVQALLCPVLPIGRRIAVLGDSGGQGALAADALAACGLSVPALSEHTRAEVSALLPAHATVTNPVDLAGAGEADLKSYPRTASVLLGGPDTDAVLLTGYFGDYAAANPDQQDAECAAAEALAAAMKESGRPLAVHTMARNTAALRVLRRHGVPVFERVEQAAAALANAARWTTATVRETAAPVSEDAITIEDGGYEAVRRLLAGAGVAFPAAAFVADVDDAVRHAAAHGYPVVLKAMGLAHKTEAGGVALGLSDERSLRAAFSAMRERTSTGRFCVEAMINEPHSVELICGVRRDRSFGPVAMVGMGGVTAELLADNAVALAPLNVGDARELLLSLRHARLLTGWRGAPPAAVDAAAEVLVILSRIAATHPEVSEIEINPLVVHPAGAIALDAHAVIG